MSSSGCHPPMILLLHHEFAVGELSALLDSAVGQHEMISGMAKRNVELNTAQAGLLAWIQEGCPAGIYAGWAHRVMARSLHNHGLVVVTGRGPTWNATLTSDGAHYLEHGTYPEPTHPHISPRDGLRATGPAEPGLKPPLTRTSNRPLSPKKSESIQEYVGALAEAGSRGLRVPWADGRVHRQRALKARRDGLVPEGMQISFRRMRDDDKDELWVKLAKQPAWHATVLRPARGHRDGLEQSDVVRALSESATFHVAGGPRDRALRILDALVTGARAEGMTVTSATAQLVHRARTASSSLRDELVFVGVAGEVRAWVTQDLLQLPHEPTERELTRARQGYLFPDHDEVPAEFLGIALDGSGVFWGKEWKESDAHGLEEDLGQVLEEIRFRHEAQADYRDAELRRSEAIRRRLEEAQHEWDLARDRAVTMFKEQRVIDEMLAQAKQWNQVSELRRYAEAIRAKAASLDDEPRTRALDWAGQLDNQADAMDPLRKAAASPVVIPEPSREELKPYMGSRGLFRP
jgi:hypothetical protein